MDCRSTGWLRSVVRLANGLLKLGSTWIARSPRQAATISAKTNAVKMSSRAKPLGRLGVPSGAGSVVVRAGSVDAGSVCAGSVGAGSVLVGAAAGPEPSSVTAGDSLVGSSTSRELAMTQPYERG